MELKLIKYSGSVVPFNRDKIYNSILGLRDPNNSSLPDQVVNSVINEVEIYLERNYGDNPIYAKLLVDLISNLLETHGYPEYGVMYRNKPVGILDTVEDYDRLDIMENIDFFITQLNFYACNLFNFKDGILGTEYWCSISNKPVGVTAYVNSIIDIFNDNRINGHCKIKCVPGIDHLLMPATRYTFIDEYKKVLLSNFPDYSISIERLNKALHKYELPHVSILTDEGIEYITNQTIEELGHIEKSRISIWIKQAKTRTSSIVSNSMFKLLFCLYNLINENTSVEYLSSINLGTCLSNEGRMVMISLLTSWYDLIETDKYKYHPTLVVKLKKGINKIGDPNHDIIFRVYEFSLGKSYIRYLNLDATYNLPYFRFLTPHSEISAMSCFSGDSELDVMVNSIKYRSIRAVDFMHILTDVVSKDDIHYLTMSKIYELERYDIKIYDTVSNNYVKCLKFIINADSGNWYKLSISFICKDEILQIKHMYLTSDHIVPILDGTFVEIKDISKDTLLLPVRDKRTCKAIVDSNRYMGHMDELGYDLETSSGTFDLDQICSHNCRTRIIDKIAVGEEFISSRGDLISAYLNLPRLAIKSNYMIDKFYKNLNITISILVLKLLKRISQNSCKPIQFSYTNYDTDEIEKQIQFIGEELRNKDISMSDGGIVSISFVGLAECIYALTGKIHGDHNHKDILGIEIYKHIYDTLQKYKEVLDINIKLSGKYDDTLATRFINTDRRYFGSIPGITDKLKYEDSFHISKEFRCDVSHQIEREVPYHRLCKGDSCSKFILRKKDIDTLDKLDHMIELICNSDIGQFSLYTDDI